MTKQEESNPHGVAGMNPTQGSVCRFDGLLIEDAFMRRMLVNQIQIVVLLRQQIQIVELAEIDHSDRQRPQHVICRMFCFSV